jgi:hypothetical protein
MFRYGELVGDGDRGGHTWLIEFAYVIALASYMHHHSRQLKEHVLLNLSAATIAN